MASAIIEVQVILLFLAINRNRLRLKNRERYLSKAILQIDNLLHAHWKLESWAFVDACRIQFNFTAASFDNALDDSEAKADSFLIHILCPRQLAKSTKEFARVWLRYATSCVAHLHL